MRRGVKLLVVAAGLAVPLLLVATMYNSRQWVGATFPGFFVMANRIVPSISLPGWFDAAPGALFQHQVTAVDGVPVASSEAVYAAVRSAAPGTAVRYTLRSAGGDVADVTVRSRRFSAQDYALLFGTYLLNGTAFFLIGYVVFLLKPRDAAGLGLLAAGLCTSVFITTAVDLYGPHWFFRLHALAEALVPATFIHFAAVFPTDRLHGRRLPLLAAIYAPFVVLGVGYELFLYSGLGYYVAHLLSSIGLAVGGACIIASAAYDFFTSTSALVRRRTAVVTVGVVAGLSLPTVLMAVSGLLGGSVPINGAALTAFVFPLAIAYAIVKRDLFEIDVMLRRTVSYAVVVIAISTGYFVAWLAYGLVLPGSSLGQQSPVTLALLNLGLLFLIAPMRERVQRTVDGVFFRKEYDAEPALAHLSQAFGVALTDDEVEAQLVRILDETICPSGAALFELQDSVWICRDPVLAPDVEAFALPPQMGARLQAGDVLTRYEWEDGSGRRVPAVWQTLGAHLIVPVRSGETTMALLVLGPRRSGHPYTGHDLAFLRTAANQVALALTNAATLRRQHELNRRLERLNLRLEEQVRERTAAVEVANGELQHSLDELRQAYGQLERNQAGLLRADRLATLGRLTAGIAHEMNTPLGAVLNALKLIADTGREYASSIDDPAVLPVDHREIAAEITSTAEIASQWTRKAAAFIRSVKSHGRDLGPAVAEPFQLATAVMETRTLLDHRLRASAVTIDYHEHPVNIVLIGDRARLGQVLVNLVNNAVDAYEDSGIFDGRIEISAVERDEEVCITVRDRAGGIDPSVLPHIFEELYTTKSPHRGTGLGLWIARNLIEEGFGGTLEVESQFGLGTCFVACVPTRDAHEALRDPPLSAAC